MGSIIIFFPGLSLALYSSEIRLTILDNLFCTQIMMAQFGCYHGNFKLMGGCMKNKSVRNVAVLIIFKMRSVYVPYIAVYAGLYCYKSIPAY